MSAQDSRTLAQLARDALIVQDACNLSGVAHGLVLTVARLRAIYPTANTDTINRHPIVKLWVDKLASLAGTQHGCDWVMAAYREVQDWAAPSTERVGVAS